MRRLSEEERKEQVRVDRELVRRALAADPTAVRELVDRMRFVPRAVGAKNAELGRPLGPAEVEDLCQDVLVAVWRKLSDYAGTGTLDAWIYRFCFLQFLSHLRRRHRGPRLLADVAVDATRIAAEVAPDVVDNERLYSALDDVGPPDADVVRLKHLEDLTFEEIGARLEISPNTAKSRYYRGLRRMRVALERGVPRAQRDLA